MDVETGRRMRETDRKIGDLTGCWEEMVENLVSLKLHEKLKR
jgi:hypothetical protein